MIRYVLLNLSSPTLQALVQQTYYLRIYTSKLFRGGGVVRRFDQFFETQRFLDKSVRANMRQSVQRTSRSEREIIRRWLSRESKLRIPCFILSIAFQQCRRRSIQRSQLCVSVLYLASSLSSSSVILTIARLMRLAIRKDGSTGVSLSAISDTSELIQSQIPYVIAQSLTIVY